MSERVNSTFGTHSTALEVVEGHDLSGKTVLITGGASGVGLETTRALARANADVIIAARDATKARSDLIEAGLDGCEIRQVDLGSLRSVRNLAQQLGDVPVHILINNAGIMHVPEGRTEDGFELHLGVNHLGHFLLTMLLAPNLKAAQGARVVILSSSAHRLSRFDPEDPNFDQRRYDPGLAYGASKGANALCAMALDRKLRDQGVRAFAVMPGVVFTPLMRHTPKDHVDVLKSVMTRVIKTPKAGASTTLWAAVAKELDGMGGLYLENCAQAGPTRPDVRGIGVEPYIFDEVLQDHLWEWSMSATGLA